jgi:hypothetical protein
MLHFVDRRFPPRTGQSLLRDEIRTVANSTAGDDEPLSTRTQHCTYRLGILLRKGHDGREDQEADLHNTSDDARSIHVDELEP